MHKQTIKNMFLENETLSHASESNAFYSPQYTRTGPILTQLGHTHEMVSE